jgi:hypothetical protein
MKAGLTGIGLTKREGQLSYTCNEYVIRPLIGLQSIQLTDEADTSISYQTELWLYLSSHDFI